MNTAGSVVRPFHTHSLVMLIASGIRLGCASSPPFPALAVDVSCYPTRD
jgi:hypothetical protein